MTVAELIKCLQQCDQSKEAVVSVDMSTGESDSCDRVFGRTIECICNDPTDTIILAEFSGANFEFSKMTRK